MVGSRWQRYKDYRKTLLRVEPLTLQEREKMSEARVDLTEPGFYSKAVHDQMALNQALIVLICEGRRLKALGQPLPHSVEDLRPAVKDALKPYTEWLSLEQSGGTVNVGRWFFLGRGQKVTMGGARFEDRSLI